MTINKKALRYRTTYEGLPSEGEEKIGKIMILIQIDTTSFETITVEEIRVVII